MTDIRDVTTGFAVAPQIEPEDMPHLAGAGFKRIICNRPDAEVPPPLSSAAMAAAAQAAGLDFVHIPFAGMPDPAKIEAVFTAVRDAGGPVLAYCRSGTRSITAWAVGQAVHGEASRQDLIDQARRAGYDLSGVLG